MMPFSTESGTVKSLQDFLPYIKSIVQRLINNEIEELAGRGYCKLEVLQNIVASTRRTHHRKSGQSEKNSPCGLYWFKIPPDHVIERALEKAHCLDFDESSSFFIEKCQPLMDDERECNYDFSLKDILDGHTPLATSWWAIELPMWDENGETQLTLRMETIINSGNPSFSIVDLEVM